MTISKLLLSLIISPALLLAQLTNNSVTAAASQSAAIAPDEAIFLIIVAAGAGTTLEDIVSALSSLGVTSANLVDVLGPPTPLVQWTFQLTVPLTKLKDTTAALASLQKSISQNSSGLSLSFLLLGTQLSGQQSPNCNFATLVAQARTQAQQIAASAGFNAGTITGLASATSTACSVTVTFALGAMFAQAGPNTITITASRTNTAQPDQASINLSVTSAVTAGLDDITGALTGAGITGANLTGTYTTTIYISNGYQPALSWSFTVTVPLSQVTATLAQIAPAQQAIAKQNSGLTLTFSGANVSSSQSQLPSSCPQAGLVADAQAQAQKIGAAAGVSVGPVLGVSEGSSAGLIPTAIASADFGYGSFLLGAPSVTAACTLTVQFQLL